MFVLRTDLLMKEGRALIRRTRNPELETPKRAQCRALPPITSHQSRLLAAWLPCETFLANLPTLP